MRRVAQQVLPCAAGARPLTAVGQVNVERVTGIDIANKTISTQGHIFTCHPRFPSHSGFVKNFRQCATDEIQTGICASELIAVMRMSFLHTSHVVVPTVDNPCHFFHPSFGRFFGGGFDLDVLCVHPAFPLVW